MDRTKMWKGLTRSDISKFDIIFDESHAKNKNNKEERYSVNNKFSLCPVCLNYVELNSATDCMYMKHNCSDNEYYHKELYDKYKNDEGSIRWCTICSRICLGHRHYKLVKHNEPKVIVPVEEGGSGSFGEEDCISAGGGGNDEKFARFRMYRQHALKLEDDIDKKTNEEALNEIVEHVWDAPLHKWDAPFHRVKAYHSLKRKFFNIVGRKKSWNISTNRFRENKQNSTIKKNHSNLNIPFTGVLPKLVESGTNNIMGDNDVEVIQFQHKQSDGATKKHGITKEFLEEFIIGQNKSFGVKEFGFCFMGGGCESKLHPAEIKNFVNKELYNDYRKKFNNKFNPEDVLQEATGVTCPVGSNPLNNNKNRKTQKRRRIK